MKVGLIVSHRYLRFKLLLLPDQDRLMLKRYICFVTVELLVYISLFMAFAEAKEQVVEHLANFAYDPFNFGFLRTVRILSEGEYFNVEAIVCYLIRNACNSILVRHRHLKQQSDDFRERCCFTAQCP